MDVSYLAKTEKNSFVTKNEWVYSKIKEDIVQGVLGPGYRIVVSKIAQAYNVSPMPIRDALNRLCQDGFVEITPHSGATVISIGLEQLYEIMVVRQNLEALAASLAAGIISDADLGILQNLYAEMVERANEKDINAYEVLNWEFHEFLYSRCGNKTLYDALMTLWRKSSITRSVFARFPNKTDSSIQEHKKLLEAIAKRDVELTYEVMLNHIKFTTDRLSQVLSTQNI